MNYSQTHKMLYTSETSIILREIRSMRREMRMKINKLSLQLNEAYLGMSGSSIPSVDYVPELSSSYHEQYDVDDGIGCIPESITEKVPVLVPSKETVSSLKDDMLDVAKIKLENFPNADFHQPQSTNAIVEQTQETLIVSAVNKDISDCDVLQKNHSEVVANDDGDNDEIFPNISKYGEYQESINKNAHESNTEIHALCLAPNEEPTQVIDTQSSTSKISILVTADGSYKCKVCSRTYTSRGNLIRHHRIHTDEKKYYCELCEKKFHRRDHLLSHMNNPLSHQNKNLGNIQPLPTLVHFSKLGDEGNKFYFKEIESTSTNLTPSKKSNHNKHNKDDMIIERSDGKYQCKTCSKLYTSKGNLQRHQRIHKGDFRYECEMCSMKFVRKEYLIYHMKKHTERPPIVKPPRKMGKYESEMVSDYGHKTYQCTYCKKLFATYPNLKRHVRLHTGETPYACGLCEAKFYREDFLQRHMKKVH